MTPSFPTRRSSDLRHAGEAGIANASFEVADAGDYNGDGFDLIAFFDCLHDMADPLGAAHHARQALRLEGTCMLVEPFAGDTVASTLNPVGRLSYGASSQRSEEHTSELQSLMRISYAVFCWQ